jgi:hypothetical protein
MIVEGMMWEWVIYCGVEVSGGICVTLEMLGGSKKVCVILGCGGNGGICGCLVGLDDGVVRLG